MSVTINPTNDSVVYSPSNFEIGGVVAENITVTNSATLVEIPDLTLAVGKYERILFRATLFYTTTATGDLKYRVDVPASPTVYRVLTEENAPAATALVTSVLSAEADDTVLSASATEGVVRLTGVLVNGANVGEVQFQFAQNTATGAESAVMLAGSFIEYRRF